MAGVNAPESAPAPANATPALILAILGLIFWLLPIAGLPISIAGLVLALRALPTGQRRKALIAVVLSALGILLALGYAAVGVYVGMHWGEPPS